MDNRGDVRAVRAIGLLFDQGGDSNDFLKLVGGCFNKTETVDITIPEGYNVKQIIELLAENGVGTVEDLTETASSYIREAIAMISSNL